MYNTYSCSSLPSSLTVTLEALTITAIPSALYVPCNASGSVATWSCATSPPSLIKTPNSLLTLPSSKWQTTLRPFSTSI